MGDNPPNRGPSDEDLLRAVKQRCVETGAPVVPSREIERSEYINIQQQSIAGRLQDLAEEGRVGKISVGKGYVWYIPEDEEPRGEIDFSVINWDVIPPEEIPAEKVHKHPEYEDPSYWEKVRDDGNVIARAGFWGMLLGGGVYILPVSYIPRISLTRVQRELALLAAFFGGLLILIAGGISIIATAGENLSEKGVDDWVRDHYSSVKGYLVQRIPVSISIEWKDTQ